MCFKSASENKTGSFPTDHPSVFPFLLKATPFFLLLRKSSWNYHRLLFSYALCVISKCYQVFSKYIQNLTTADPPSPKYHHLSPKYYNLWNFTSLFPGSLALSHLFSTKARMIPLNMSDYVTHLLTAPPLDFPQPSQLSHCNLSPCSLSYPIYSAIPASLHFCSQAFLLILKQTDDDAASCQVHLLLVA